MVIFLKVQKRLSTRDLTRMSKDWNSNKKIIYKKIIEDLDELYKYKWTHGYIKIKEIIDRRFDIK